MEYKICKTCGRELPLDRYYFWKKRNSYDCHCKECVSERKKMLYRTKYGEHHREYNRKRYQENKEYCDKKNKEWVEKNREKHNSYTRKYKEKNKEKIKLANKKYERENPEKVRAHHYLNNRIHRGLIKRGESCEICGAEGYVEAHHDDYSKPLDVIWCCKKCHWKLDEARREKERA